MSGKTIFVARVKDPRGIFHSFVKEYGYYIIVPEDSINLSVLKKEYLFRLVNTSRNGHAVVILLEDKCEPRLFMRFANDRSWKNGGHPHYYLNLIDTLWAYG